MTQYSGESRMDRKKEQTKQKIIAAAMTLFHQQGFDATSMEQIAEQADIAKGTLYNYFPVKEAIFGEFMQRSFQEKSAERGARLRALPDTRARLTAILSELLRGVQAQREMFERFMVYRMKTVLSFQKTEDERSGVESLSTLIIRLGQESGELRSDMPAGLLEDLFDFVMIEMVKQTSPDGAGDAPEKVVDYCVDLFLHGTQREER